MNFDLELTATLEKALAEDFGAVGDLTSNLLLEERQAGSATIVSKESGVVAGLEACGAVFRAVDPNLEVEKVISDGTAATPGDHVLNVHGSARSILAAERTALNFLQRLSGIATLTARFVEQISGTRCKILDTRKTAPGLRLLEKYAVTVGGGHNHRFGLYDMILIKENHIRLGGGIEAAVARIRNSLSLEQRQIQIEVETTSLPEVKVALHAGADRIMLDNMTLAEMKVAVEVIDGRCEVEASGGVDLGSVREIAGTGVDYISVGAITHSARAFDFTLLFN